VSADALRETLFQDLAAGRPLDRERLALLARLSGRTAAALALDLYAEALGVA
jgi:hypothetical protein